MNKAITTTYPLVIIAAAMFLAITPCIKAQSPAPASAPAIAPAPMLTAPSPSLDCLPYILNTSDCLTYVEPGSNMTEPDPGCCPELAYLVNTQPICLCEFLSNSTGLGISIDKNKALKLPSVCQIKTPPVSSCAAVGEPVSVPTPSEGPPQGGSEAGSSSPGNEDGRRPNNFASGRRFFFGLVLLLATSFF